MDSSVLHQFERFQLGAEEDSSFHLEAADVQLSSDECNRSLVGKIFGDKVANFSGLKNTLAILWSSVKPFKTRELGVNMYQFVFDSEMDKQKVFHGKAWSFDSQFLVLQPWSANIDFSSAQFYFIPVWVQIWNIPPPMALQRNWISVP